MAEKKDSEFPSQSQPQTDVPKVKVGVMPETMRLISRVLQKCEEEKYFKLDISFDDPIQRAVTYTGIHKDVITQVHKILNMSEQFTEFEIEELDRNVIRRALMHFYFDEELLPTTQQLYNAVQQQLPEYVDIRMFRKELLKMNYMWKKIPNKTLVVIENPSSMFERYHYIKRIIEYRKENRPIVFIDVCYINCKNEVKTLKNLKDLECDKEGHGYFMYAVSRDQVYALEAHQHYSVFSKDLFENWISETLCFHIPHNSVVVMNNLEYNREEVLTLPTEYGLKREMIEWLEFHDINCDRSMSKSELFSRVVNYTNYIDRLYKIDQIFKVYDHDVLRIPDSIENLTPATFVHDLMKTKFEDSNQMSRNKVLFFKYTINKLNETHLEEYDDYISSEELLIFETDKKLDEKMEKMWNNMEGLLAYDEEPDSDVPTLSDSD